MTERTALPGGDWILDAPTEIPAVWGGDTNVVAWAKGEGLMLVGPDGVGKTTLGQQLALTRAGLRRELLGMTVDQDDRPVLYIAADRPQQARRSLARMVTADDREALNERLIIWPGPLPFDLAENPKRLLRFAEELGAGTVFIDSLKDVALDLVKDETGSRVNQAVQEVIAAGIELCALHHQKKEQDGRKPTRLADVYGSRWLTAGMGSVVLLWGDPGDLVVDLRHLKQPAEDVGPLTVIHDHGRGLSTLKDEVNLEEVLWNATAGLTAADAAGLLYARVDPTANEVEKARRKLERLVRKGVASRNGMGPPDPVRYHAREERA